VATSIRLSNGMGGERTGWGNGDQAGYLAVDAKKGTPARRRCLGERAPQIGGLAILAEKAAQRY